MPSASSPRTSSAGAACSTCEASLCSWPTLISSSALLGGSGVRVGELRVLALAWGLGYRRTGRLSELRVGLDVKDLGDAQTVLLVDDNDLTTGDRAAVDQQVGCLTGETLQRNNGANTQIER